MYYEKGGLDLALHGELSHYSGHQHPILECLGPCCSFTSSSGFLLVHILGSIRCWLGKLHPWETWADFFTSGFSLVQPQLLLGFEKLNQQMEENITLSLPRSLFPHTPLSFSDSQIGIFKWVDLAASKIIHTILILTVSHLPSMLGKGNAIIISTGRIITPSTIVQLGREKMKW